MKTTNDNLRRIMATAWNYVKTNLLTMSEALKRAWKEAKLEHGLKSGIKHFTFIKKDGSLRFAVGTLCPSLTPSLVGNKGQRKHNPNIQIFYDMEKHEWRSFIKSNLISIQ